MTQPSAETNQPINRPKELSENIQTLIAEYVKSCPEPIDFFDILEALGLTGLSVLYEDAVLHPQPIFSDEQFKTVAELSSDLITKALSDKGLTPVVELIGVITNMAHLARYHNQKIKEHLSSELASSEAEVATTAPMKTE